MRTVCRPDMIGLCQLLSPQSLNPDSTWFRKLNQLMDSALTTAHQKPHLVLLDHKSLLIVVFTDVLFAN